MKIRPYYFYKDIDETTVSEAIMDLDNMDLGDNDVLYFYLYTDGGVNGAQVVLSHYLENCNAKEVHIYASGGIHSSGFDLFFDTKVSKKAFIGPTYAILHQSSFEASTQQLSDKEHPVLLEAKEVEKRNKEHIAKLKKMGLPKEYIKRIKQGKDVHVPFEVLKKLLKDNK